MKKIYWNKGDSENFYMKKLDKVLIVGVLLISAISYGVMAFSRSNNDDNQIAIQVDEKVVKTIPLNNSNESIIHEFRFDENIGYIEVQDGKVRMLEMDQAICPNAICSDTGWIQTSFQSIVCLPNKIVVTIKSNQNHPNNPEEVDIVI